MKSELADRVVDAFKVAGLDFVSFLPESRLPDIIPLIEKDNAFTMVRATHEGSAVSIASGAALVGRKPVAYMEATGLILSLYNLESAAIRCGLPVLLFVSYVGSSQDELNSMTFSAYGKKVEGLLRAMNIQYDVLDDDRRLEERIVGMARAAQAAKHPACLLLTGDFTEIPKEWS